MLAAIPFLLLPVCCGLDAASGACSGEVCHELDDAGLLQLKHRDRKTMALPKKTGRQGLRWWGKMQGGCGRSHFKKHEGGIASPLSASPNADMPDAGQQVILPDGAEVMPADTQCTPAVDESLSNGPTMKHCDIPKYVTPLVIPPVMKKSGRDRYQIAVREFQQQILPGGMWNNRAFANYNGGQAFNYSATTVWSFGPAGEPQPDSSSLGGGVGIAPAQNSQFNYPSYTVETVTHRRVKVDWINHLVKDPWHCDPYKPRKCKQCEFLQHLLTVDQSLHWANPGKLPCTNGKETDCMPMDSPELRKNYTGPVPLSIHLHGAHVQPESDGYPEAWYLPAASNIPKGYATVGSLVNKYGLGRNTNLKPGIASFEYANDQPTTTLWFHDHTLGVTRNNVYAGPAGFWLIRKADGGEDGLVSGTLPYPAPKAGQCFLLTNIKNRNAIREIPIVLQDRSFSADASLFYPADRAFFDNLNVSQLRIPLLGDVTQTTANPVPPTDVPPKWNPETFFDTIVVNGVTWPLLEVEPDIYRFRLLNGCNCRTFNLLMYVVDASGNKLQEVPFYVIGGDQSLLPNVTWVKENYSTALPGDGTFPTPTPSGEGEGLFIPTAVRRDILIDFRELEVGTLIQIFNTGPDKAPFSGFPIPPFNISEPGSQANPGTTGQVMRFRVVKDTSIGEDATPPQDLQFTLVDASDPAADVNPASITNARQLSLNEYDSADVCAAQDPNGDITYDPLAIVDPSDLTQCIDKTTGALADSAPFGPLHALLGTVDTSTIPPVTTGELWSDPVSQFVQFNATETWAIWDFTVDSHPIHLHLAKFRIIGARTFDATTGELGGWEVPNPVDAGWKDTVNALPGYVTYLKARFDIKGLYVWHCHTLEHEDQEMMLPYCVVGDGGNSPGCPAANKTALLDMEAQA